MDINNLNANNPLDRRLREAEARRSGEPDARAADRRQTEVEANSQRGDEVSLSSKAQHLRDIEGRVAEQEAFDQKRVDDIRAAIAEGRYHVDPERLAERFVELEKQLNQ